MSLVAAAMLFIGLPGCGMFDNWRGDGFNDDFAKSGTKLRPPSETSSEPWFFSTKSRQIEQDLGY